MDEALRTIEERLEGLVPKGISDPGRERLEETIDQFAESVAGRESSGSAWKWVAGVAACLGLVAGAQLLRDAGPGPVVAEPIGVPVSGAIAAAEPVKRLTEADLMRHFETVSSSRHVEDRVDEGWVQAEGSPHVYRMWSYDVTDEEEILDEETGYMVTVISQRQERIPVRMTSL